MEIVGIFAYSFALTSISHYVKEASDKKEEFIQKCEILDDIKVTEVKVKDNKNGYYIQGQDLDLTVSYSNNNGVKDKETTNYTITKVTPQKCLNLL